MAEISNKYITGSSPIHACHEVQGLWSHRCCGKRHVETGIGRRIERKELNMWILAAFIGLPLCLALAGAGVLVESIRPDELRSMGVDPRS